MKEPRLELSPLNEAAEVYRAAVADFDRAILAEAALDAALSQANAEVAAARMALSKARTELLRAVETGKGL